MPHFFTKAERAELAKQGVARPDGSYPIRNQADLDNAQKDWIRTGRDPKIAAWIATRAKALKLPNPAQSTYNDLISQHAEKVS